MALFPHFSELEFTFVRSSGPGGQNVNKVNSKAVLRWNTTASACMSEEVRARFHQRFGSKLTSEGDLLLSSDSYRDQGRNRDDCLEKLKAMLNSPLPNDYVAKHVALYQRAGAGTIPKLMFPKTSSVGAIESADVIVHLIEQHCDRR